MLLDRNNTGYEQMHNYCIAETSSICIRTETTKHMVLSTDQHREKNNETKTKN